MSRKGRIPIVLPKGVEVKVEVSSSHAREHTSKVLLRKHLPSRQIKKYRRQRHKNIEKQDQQTFEQIQVKLQIHF